MQLEVADLVTDTLGVPPVLEPGLILRGRHSRHGHEGEDRRRNDDTEFHRLLVQSLIGRKLFGVRGYFTQLAHGGGVTTTFTVGPSIAGGSSGIPLSTKAFTSLGSMKPASWPMHWFASAVS